VKISWLLVALQVLVLSACQEQVVETSPPAAIRSVKLFTVNEVSEISERKFSGTTVATTSASLSFPVSGKIIQIFVNEGEEVSKGQLLAKLDATSYEREKNMAVAQSQQAKVILADKQGDYNRKKPLGDKGVITLRDLEESKAAMLTAKEQVNLAHVQLKQAEDTVRDTFLYSPYEGIISERSSEPFVEITSGQQIFLLENQGAREVEISVPENILDKINLGQPAKIAVKTTAKVLSGTVSEIAASADVGNVFTVKVKVDESEANLYSGLSAEVILGLADNGQSAGFMIPLSCIVAGNDNQDYVYVFQPETDTVKKTQVTHTLHVIGNALAVEGVNPGDQVVAAGVTFLSDGLIVKPFQTNQ